MVDISKEVCKKMLMESRKPKHIFNDDSLTFKQLKDIFSNVFGTNIVGISRKVPVAAMYLTNKDGKYYVASVDKPRKLMKVDTVGLNMKLNECDKAPVKTTLADIVEALRSIDQVQLNRCFANGNNMLKCTLVCPPNGCSHLYGDKCFLQFDGVDCFDSKGKCVGRDEDASVELLDMLKNDPTLDYEFTQLNAEQLNAMKHCRNEKRVLQNILNALQKLVDGIGWGCTLKYYIQDKYARHIVNKALEHGLDVSKNGAFVEELASRLSGTSSSRPTKSDLVTFAKREGINCGSQEYKDFLNDLESDADNTSREIILPIENVIYYGVSKAAQNILALLALDPNPRAQKLLKLVATDLFTTCDDIEKCGFDCNCLDGLKKALQKIALYKDIAPAEVRVMNGGKPYAIVGDPSKIEALLEVVS